jgi:thioredoxin-dependent peroxiredoxin
MCRGCGEDFIAEVAAVLITCEMMKRLFAPLLALIGSISLANAEPLAIGASVPSVTAVDHTGKEVKLDEVFKKGPTLVFFYPKAHTGGCTKQVCGMRDNLTELTTAGLQVIGVSMDQAADQKSFVEKQNLNFPLLADTKGEVVKAFGVPEIKAGLPSRQSFIVKEGKVVWRDLAVKPTEHAASIKQALAEVLKKP